MRTRAQSMDVSSLGRVSFALGVAVLLGAVTVSVVWLINAEQPEPYMVNRYIITHECVNLIKRMRLKFFRMKYSTYHKLKTIVLVTTATGTP